MHDTQVKKTARFQWRNDRADAVEQGGSYSANQRRVVSPVLEMYYALLAIGCTRLQILCFGYVGEIV